MFNGGYPKGHCSQIYCSLYSIMPQGNLPVSYVLECCLLVCEVNGCFSTSEMKQLGSAIVMTSFWQYLN